MRAMVIVRPLGCQEERGRPLEGRAGHDGAPIAASYTDEHMAARLHPLGLLLIILLGIGVYTLRVRHEMIDFLTWRQAVVRSLHAESLYRVEDGHYQFKYLPTFALIMAPFGAVGPEAGKVLWFAILVALLTTLLRGSIAALPARRRSTATLGWITGILMAKFYAHELLLGQTNLPLAVLLLGALVAAQHDRPSIAGALTGLAVFIKPYALVLVPWLFAAHGWLAAATAGAAVAAGLLLPAAVYGWTGNLDLLRDWARTVTDSTSPNLLGSDNVSIAAMWAKWIGPTALAATLAWLTMAALAALIVAAWRRRRTVAAPDYLECALLMLLVPLISPQGCDYVLLLATPAVVCVIDRWPELSRPWQIGLAIALALMGLTMFDAMGRTLYRQFMALSLVSVCALGVAAGLVHLRWRRLA